MQPGAISRQSTGPRGEIPLKYNSFRPSGGAGKTQVAHDNWSLLWPILTKLSCLRFGGYVSTLAERALFQAKENSLFLPCRTWPPLLRGKPCQDFLGISLWSRRSMVACIIPRACPNSAHTHNSFQPFNRFKQFQSFQPFKSFKPCKMRRRRCFGKNWLARSRVCLAF